MGQQGEDSPLTEDTERSKESNNELENELKCLKVMEKSVKEGMLCCPYSQLLMLCKKLVRFEYGTRRSYRGYREAV